jgi:hypothetical protein
MLNGQYIVVLDGESPVETEAGGQAYAETVACSNYFPEPAGYFEGEHQPTYDLITPNGGMTVRESDVVRIIDQEGERVVDNE